MYRRFLVPLDGSHLAESVLPIVGGLALACHASVVLLHIIERAAHPTVHGDRHITTPEESMTYLRDIASDLSRQGCTVVLHTHDAPEGDVARSIADHADEEGADLIVLCAHGRGGVRGWLFGGIAKQVLRTSGMPVLLVRPAPDGARAFAPKTLLVPLDSSPSAEVALAPAKALARVLHAALRLVIVVPTQATLRGERAASATLLPFAAQAALELECDEAREYLGATATLLRAEGFEVSTALARGDIAGALATQAAMPEIGLVVVATHGLAGLQTMWTTSATSALLARPGPPVLLLRPLAEAAP